MSERFERHAFTFTLLTLVSRATGLARDAAMSRAFGSGAVMDAFSFAFMIPNLFRRLFGEGALSAAILPVYTRLQQGDPAAARRLASLTIAALVAALGGITLLVELVLLALSHTSGIDHLAIRLMMIMLPYMPLVCIVAILGAMLQVHGRFGPTAASPIILNLLIVMAALGFFLPNAPGSESHITIVASAVLVAGLAQVIWMLWSLRSHHQWTREFAGAGPALKEVLRQAGPMILGLGVLQLNTFIDNFIASYPTIVGPTIFGRPYPLSEGAMASLSYAQRLYEFPLGVFGIAVGTAIFPALSRVAADGEKFLRTLQRGMRLVVFIGLPASAGLILVREPMTAVILQGREFTADDTARVAFILLGYAPAIWAYSMSHVLTRAFYARGDSMTPVKIALGVVGLNFLLNVTLIWTPLREAGLAWSTAICSVIQIALQTRILSRRVGGVIDPEVRSSWMKTALLTATMVAAVWIITQVTAIDAQRWRDSLLLLTAQVGVGAAIVTLGSMSLKMPELRWALGRSV